MHVSKSEYARERIKRTHVKITPQRVAVLAYLLHSDTHPTAYEIYRSITSKFLSLNLATVYNNLHILCENGLARELTLENKASRFDGNPTNHYHVICNMCDKVVDLPYPLLKEIEAFVEQTSDFEVSHHQLNIYGKCATCRN